MQKRAGVIKSEELNPLFKEALKSALLELKSLLERRQYITLWPVEEPEFLPDGLINKIRVVLKLLVLSLPDVQQRIGRVPQVSKLCEFIASSDFSEQLVAKQAATPAAEQILHRLFWPFLKHYLSEVEELDFDPNVFQDTYEETMAYFSLPTVKFVFTAPLFGFDTESNESSIDLAPNVSIKRISSELKKQLWRDASISSSWNREDVVSLKYQAAFKEDVPKTDLFSYRRYPEDVENFQHLLRLIKREPIFIGCVVFSSSPWYLGSYTGLMPAYLPWPTANPLIGRYFYAGAFQRQILTFSFSPEEIENLKLAWASLSSMKNIPRFTLALRRLSLSYDRPSPEDKLIDLWVGLEALFSMGFKQELRYRIPLRIAYFLGKTADERKKTFKEVRASYDCRSSVVHGNQLKRDLHAKTTKQTEGYLARSLLTCLCSRTVPSADELEAKILKGG